jgi:photosystem II stability/assembly factor-like uncharacterized protein
MAFSPRWTSDRVMLAGTAGAGVLRSIDGGRRWLLSNFGLQDYTVLALAPATDWSRREVIFAGTVDGAYRSSGGGRAWKPAGLAGLPVQALAASAGYAENGVVLAGTEGAGLVRTTDGGESWQPVGDALGRDISVNALLRVADGEGEAWLAATDAGDLWRSVDAGVTWARVYENGEPVLALSVSPDGATLWAGTSEHGALVSRDLGCTWAPDTQLCGWGFRRLLNPGGEAVLAWAPTGGVWRSEDGGRGWERIVASSHYEPVFAYLPVADGALEARTEGLWLRQEEEDQPALDTGDAPVVALAADRSAAVIWAADAAGGLASSRDGGGSWQVVAVPWAGQQLLSLAAAPEDGTPLVATHDANSGSITVWRLTDGGWEGWLERPAKWAGAALAPAGTNGEETWAVIAGEVWAHRGSAGWREETLPAEAGAAVGLAQRGDVHCLIAGRAVLVQDADGEWETLSLPEAAAAPVDVVVRPDDGLLLLDAAGTLWLAER